MPNIALHTGTIKGPAQAIKEYQCDMKPLSSEGRKLHLAPHKASCQLWNSQVGLRIPEGFLYPLMEDEHTFQAVSKSASADRENQAPPFPVRVLLQSRTHQETKSRLYCEGCTVLLWWKRLYANPSTQGQTGGMGFKVSLFYLGECTSQLGLGWEKQRRERDRERGGSHVQNYSHKHRCWMVN